MVARMARRVWIARYAFWALWALGAPWALGSAACGTTDDNRPREAQYVTAAILAPACGAAECHSTFAQVDGYTFDTLVGMRKTIVQNGLVKLDSTQFDPAAPQSSYLIAWITEIDPLGLGIGRMPRDAPLPNEDIHFIEQWITGPTDEQDQGTTCTASTPCVAGATCKFSTGSATGECYVITYKAPAHGAQCNYQSKTRLGCLNRKVYNCNSDWNLDLSTVVQDCAGDCENGACQ